MKRPITTALALSAAVTVAWACGTTGGTGPVSTPTAKAQGDPNWMWCDEGYACVLKDYDEITPQMLGAVQNRMYCSNRGVSTVALKWERDKTKPNADAYKVTRLGVLCPD